MGTENTIRNLNHILNTFQTVPKRILMSGETHLKIKFPLKYKLDILYRNTNLPQKLYLLKSLHIIKVILSVAVVGSAGIQKSFAFIEPDILPGDIHQLFHLFNLHGQSFLTSRPVDLIYLRSTASTRWKVKHYF